MDEKPKNKKLLYRNFEEELQKAAAKPTWQSSNEGVHERVSFEDTIWGFNLAGGSDYNIPLRVTQVKESSRAEHAGIKVGDILKSINNIETTTITVKEAHAMILESGFEIKLAFSAPDVVEPTYYMYQDEYEEEQKEGRRLLELESRKQIMTFKGAKTNETWSLAWPCNKKRDVMYKESNCFMVPSKYESKHLDRIPNVTESGTA